MIIHTFKESIHKYIQCWCKEKQEEKIRIFKFGTERAETYLQELIIK
jgi:hypothetical protein